MDRIGRGGMSEAVRHVAVASVAQREPRRAVVGIQGTLGLSASPPSAAAIAASLASTAALLADAAAGLQKLAQELENQLAARDTRALMVGMQAPAPKPRLLGVPDLAERLGVGPRTVRRWRREGKLPPALALGGVVRWDPVEVERWLAERREPGTGPHSAREGASR